MVRKSTGCLSVTEGGSLPIQQSRALENFRIICSTQTRLEPVRRLKMIQLMTCKQHCPFKPTRNVHLSLDKGGKLRHNI